MFYPKSPCCPDNPWSDNNNNSSPSPYCHDTGSKNELFERIRELSFAAYDLQLYPDTHPMDEKALELFTKINATLSSAVMDFENQYGPLNAGSSPNTVPFKWVADDYDWPWVKKGENR